MAEAKQDKGKKIERFEVEMDRLGVRSSVVIDVKDVRAGRGKRVIVSEGVFQDPQNYVRIRTRGAKTYQDVIPRSLACIDQRGFVPRAYRIWQGSKWGPWNHVVGFPKPENQLFEAEQAQKFAEDE